MKLTPEILRQAADRICPALDTSGDWFMCHAVRHVDWDARQEFEELLTFHGVGTDGTLAYKGQYSLISRDDAWNWRPQAQALRFDFLNLLAHYLED